MKAWIRGATVTGSAVVVICGLWWLSQGPPPATDTVVDRAQVVGPIGPVAAPTAAVPTVAAAPLASSVPIAARTMPARPGFRRTPSGPVLDVARFTSVASLTVPAATAARTAVLQVTLRVVVPTRIALSVRAWCDVSRPVAAAPDGRSLYDVLVIGQNPVPGGSRVQVASRTLAGRAVVVIPPGGPARCVAQVSPRTESTTGSTIRLLSGRFSASPATVPARAAQRLAVLVGSAGAPGWPATAGRPVGARAVAAVGPVRRVGGVRLEGEAELTTCALGYQLCARGTPGPSVVDVALVLADVTDTGRVCRIWRGSIRRVVITPAVHHVKVAAPPLIPSTRCGHQVRGHLLVTHRGGNAVEVEPTLGGPGGPVLVQTHTWLAAT